MNSPELSIIVPVYNVEDYLEVCVQSILSQSYSDFELLLVDDGSTDSSPQICDAFSDERIRVFHKANGGISSARNWGLKNMRGQFVTFVDSDDCYGDMDTLACNMDIMRNHPDIDILQFPAQYIKADKTVTQIAPSSTILRGADVFKEWYRGTDMLTYAVWNKIYKRGVIEGVSFSEDKCVAEDVDFGLQLMPRVAQVYISEKGCYVYYLRDKSISRSWPTKKKEEKNRRDIANSLAEVYVEATKRPALNVHRLAFLIKLLIGYMELRNDFPKSDYESIREKLFSYSITLSEVLRFTFQSGVSHRQVRHAWAFYLLGRFYEIIYLKLLAANHKQGI